MTKAYQHGLVIGKFYPPHRGHEYLIRTAAEHCDVVTVGVLGATSEGITIAQRVKWLQETFHGLHHVRVVGELDDVPVDYNNERIWALHEGIMRQAIAQADARYGEASSVDVVFTSESYGDELARRFKSHHVCLDQMRTLYPVSGTQVRADPVSTWEMLPSATRGGLALRVVMVGAESTGTTTLAKDVSTALKQRGGVWARTQWVPEFGREHSANLLALLRAKQAGARAQDIEWRTEDFTKVARQQCQWEDQAAREGGPVLVCDTDALATCIWHERYMGDVSQAVMSVAQTMPARALYVLTSEHGVAFEDDGLRDGEHLRGWMNARFRALLSAQSVPWVEVVGSPEQRCAQALEAINRRMLECWPIVDRSKR